MAERDVKKMGLATIQMLTRQRPHDINLKNLYGGEAISSDITSMKKILEWSGISPSEAINISSDITSMKKILEWSGISPSEAINIAREADGFRNDEVIRALERIIQESKSD